jgi:hypothetical protein
MRGIGRAAIDRLNHFRYKFSNMPWIRRQYQPRKPYWPVAVIALAALGVGVLIGYTRWGTTAAIVNLVEKELADTQAHIKALEKRVADMETRRVTDATGNDAGGSDAAKVKKPDGKPARELSKADKEKQVWNKEPRF